MTTTAQQSSLSSPMVPIPPASVAAAVVAAAGAEQRPRASARRAEPTSEIWEEPSVVELCSSPLHTQKTQLAKSSSPPRSLFSRKKGKKWLFLAVVNFDFFFSLYFFLFSPLFSQFCGISEREKKENNSALLRVPRACSERTRVRVCTSA